MTKDDRDAELLTARSELEIARSLVASNLLAPAKLAQAGGLVEFWGKKVAYLESVPVVDDAAHEMEN